jgi:hypothetical protein
MSHEVTIGDASVTFEQVEVDLDYNDILENIEETIYERISSQISDEAWDAVAYQVEEQTQESASEAIDERMGDWSENITGVIIEQLNDYLRLKTQRATPCGIGEAFEKAVNAAQSEGVGNVDQALEVQKRLADLERKVSTILDALFVLGERASSVDNRAV